MGGQPTIEGVRKLIDEAVKVQHCKDLIDRAGMTCRQLAVYWHPDLSVIITVDHISETAVSVLSRDQRNKHRKDFL